MADLDNVLNDKLGEWPDDVDILADPTEPPVKSEDKGEQKPEEKGEPAPETKDEESTDKGEKPPEEEKTEDGESSTDPEDDELVNELLAEIEAEEAVEEGLKDKGAVSSEDEAGVLDEYIKNKGWSKVEDAANGYQNLEKKLGQQGQLIGTLKEQNDKLQVRLDQILMNKTGLRPPEQEEDGYSQDEPSRAPVNMDKLVEKITREVTERITGHFAPLQNEVGRMSINSYKTQAVSLVPEIAPYMNVITERLTNEYGFMLDQADMTPERNPWVRVFNLIRSENMDKYKQLYIKKGIEYAYSKIKKSREVSDDAGIKGPAREPKKVENRQSPNKAVKDDFDSLLEADGVIS